MSYCRNPHYIYPDEHGVQFTRAHVPDDEIDCFLYAIFLAHRREELKKRLAHGREVYNSRVRMKDPDDLQAIVKGKSIKDLFEPVPADLPYEVHLREWLKQQEDELLKQMLGD